MIKPPVPVSTALYKFWAWFLQVRIGRVSVSKVSYIIFILAAIIFIPYLTGILAIFIAPTGLVDASPPIWGKWIIGCFALGGGFIAIVLGGCFGGYVLFGICEMGKSIWGSLKKLYHWITN